MCTRLGFKSVCLGLSGVFRDIATNQESTSKEHGRNGNWHNMLYIASRACRCEGVVRQRQKVHDRLACLIAYLPKLDVVALLPLLAHKLISTFQTPASFEQSSLVRQSILGRLGKFITMRKC